MAKSLVVLEPDDKFSKALKLYFRGMDYDVKVYAEAESALDAAKANPPSALLLAVDADDGQAAEFVRKVTAAVKSPVIIMSTRKSDSELFSGGVRRLGAADYIKKPFIKGKIVELLDKVFAGSGAPTGGGDDAIEFEPVESSAPQASSGESKMGDIIADIDQEIDSFFGPGDVPAPVAEVAAPVEVADFDPAPAKPAPQPVVARAAVVEEVAEPQERIEAGAGTTEELKRLRKRVKELEVDLRARSEEAKTAAREKERIEREYQSKASRDIEKIRGLEKQVEDLEEDIKKRKQLVTQLNQTLGSLNEEIEEKDKKLREKERDYTEQHSTLQAQVRTLTESYDQKLHDIEDKDDEIGRLSRRLEDVERELAQVNETLVKTSEERDAAEVRIEDLESRLKQLREEFTEASADLQKTRADLQRTKAELDQTRDELKDARNRIKITRESIAKGLDALGPAS